MPEIITGAQTPNHGKNHGKNGGAEREQLLKVLTQQIDELKDPHTFNLETLDLNLMDLMALSDLINIYQRVQKGEYKDPKFLSDEKLMKRIEELSAWVSKFKEQEAKDDNSKNFGGFLGNKMGILELPGQYAAYVKARSKIG